jgi:hypothetical protein
MLFILAATLPFLLLPLALLLLVRRGPPQPVPPPTDPPGAFWRDPVTGVCNFLALGLAFGWASLLHQIGKGYESTLPPAVFVVPAAPYGLVFALHGAFLGLCTASLLSGLVRSATGSRYAPWLRVMRWWAPVNLVLGLLLAATVPSLMSWSTRFTDDAVVIHPLLGFTEEARPYATVDRVVFSTKRHDQEEPSEVIDYYALYIRFRDGTKWDCGVLFNLDHFSVDPQPITEFLARKTGKPVVKVGLPEEAGEE